jgi:hypothetical protein
MERTLMLVRRLTLVASVVTPLAIISLLLGSDGGVTAGIGAARGSPPTLSPPPVIATETFTPTVQIYLPCAYKNFPLIIHVPEGEYLFVEYWTHSVMGVDCPGLCIDFPAYHFDPQSGELTMYSPDPPLLSDDDIGYIGSGESLEGLCGGACSRLTTIQSCPVTEDGITLSYVDGTGTVTLEREGEEIVLEAGEAWISDEEVEDWDSMYPGCVVTSTHRITNYAFQERDKIKFTTP